MSLPDQARVVIVGGGVHGASLLYHLVEEGWTEAVLVEKAELTSGSTWHAAGQITRSVADYTTAAFHHYAIELYERLEAKTGQGISFHQPGGLRVAYDDLELDALKAQLGIGRYIGYPIELVGPDEAAEINPHYGYDGVLAAIWTEGEGHVDPSGVTMAFASAARAAGATISRRNRVLEINRRRGGEPQHVWEVVTEQGTIRCEHVVDAAGCYAAQVGGFSEIQVAQANVLHHYLVTEKLPEFAADPGWEMPVMRDNRTAGYIRQEQTAGLIGIYEQRGAQSIWDDGVPWDAENPLFPADYDKIAPWLAEAFQRVPLMADAGIKRVVHGAITHTIDGHMLLGPAPGARNYWLNTGSSIGLAWGPGAGRELARWIVHGETELSLRHYDPRRFGWALDGAAMEHIRLKSIEDYEWMFRVHAPGEERLDHRPVWASALHETLRAKRAMHGQAYAWEQPKWFVPADRTLSDAHGWRRPDWYDAVSDECRAVRERVGIMDLSAFSKFMVHGPDAYDYLNHLTTGIVPRTHGRIALNYLLTPTGRIETEATITCLDDNLYYVVTGPVSHRRDLDWLEQHRTGNPAGRRFDVSVVDQTIETGTLVVAGPNSRELLARCTGDRAFMERVFLHEAPVEGPPNDMSNDGFPFLTARQINMKGIPVRAMRVGFTGSLGWELHVPMQDLAMVYERLVTAAQPFDDDPDLGLVDFGSHALNSLRMEKAYLTRFELTHDIGPYQAGVGRWVRPEHPAKADFIGRDALDRPPTGADWRLVYLRVDVEPYRRPAPEAEADRPHQQRTADCIGGEGLFLGDRPVGLTTSGGYGFTVDQSLAFGYVTEEAAAPGTELGVLILGEMRRATVLDRPAFDPDNEQLRN